MDITSFCERLTEMPLHVVYYSNHDDKEVYSKVPVRLINHCLYVVVAIVTETLSEK